MARGDHIYVFRLGYTHHGIDCGDGTVIHFNGEPLRKTRAAITRTPLEDFTRGRRKRTRIYRERSSPAVTMERAESRLAMQRYNLAFNNCEHFATYCCTGEFQSRQTRRVVGAVIGGVGNFPATASAGTLAGLYGLYRVVLKRKK